MIFVLQVLFPIITEQFKLTSSEVSSHPWMLLTSIFLHGSLAHLLLNMFALALFGTILEKFIGTKNFLLIFFSSGILANVGAMVFYPSALGASGAIFGVIGALAIVRPWMTVWVLGIPAPMVIAALIWAVQDLVGVFVPDNVGHIAHLLGLVVGMLGGIPFYERIKKEKRIDVLSKREMESWESQYMRK